MHDERGRRHGEDHDECKPRGDGSHGFSLVVPAVPLQRRTPEPIPPSQESQKIPYLLRKSKVRTGPKGSENCWRNPKRLAVRLAEIGSLRVTQPSVFCSTGSSPSSHCVNSGSPHGSEHGQAHTLSGRVPRSCGGNTPTGNYLPVAVRPGWVPRRGGANRLLSRGSRAPAGRSPRAPGSPRIPDCLPRRVGSIPARARWLTLGCARVFDRQVLTVACSAAAAPVPWGRRPFARACGPPCPAGSEPRLLARSG